MDDIRISLDTTGRNSELTVVRVDGVIDTMTASELERIMNTLLDQKKYKIIIDLAGVDYISSAGWGIFISNIREIKANAGDIKLARMIPSVYEIFELLEFDSILKAYDNIEKAKSEFRSPGEAPDAGASKMEASKPESAVAVEEKPAEVIMEEYQAQNTPVTQRQTRMEERVMPQTAPRSIESEVLGLVKADPFYSISELVRIVNSGSNGSGRTVGWWRVWGILRRRALLSKKSRFRFSRIA